MFATLLTIRTSASDARKDHHQFEERAQAHRKRSRNGSILRNIGEDSFTETEGHELAKRIAARQDDSGEMPRTSPRAKLRRQSRQSSRTSPLKQRRCRCAAEAAR